MPLQTHVGPGGVLTLNGGSPRLLESSDAAFSTFIALAAKERWPSIVPSLIKQSNTLLKISNTLQESHHSKRLPFFSSKP